ncbi:hypothetical protein C8R48DRAFT_792947 [Suillus tomentosus]|nr:hypothetical protein C8R48DRAFT_792947 [Suillus tomentosus]
MSTQVQSTLANLKASTAQLVGIIAGARHIPAGSVDVHLVLTKQVTTLLADIIRAHEKGEYIPGIVASCSKELMRVRSMTPRALPNWHSIGHDDPRVARHAWRKQVRAWEALGDNSCDLPVVPNVSTGPLTLNLPSPPVPSPAPVPSPTPVIPSPPVVAGPSGKRPPRSGTKEKSALKARKRVKSTQLPKSKPFVESEDDEDPIVQPISRGVPEVVLPQRTIVVRKPQSPRSPGSPKKQSFGPASLTAGSRPEVTKSPISLRSSSVAVPRAALNVPMPDLHSMAIAIRDGAARIAILEARVQEQDAKIDTLQRLHESLRRTVVDRHPSFSLPDTPADGIMLLGQGGPMVEPTQVQPEGPQSSGEIDLPDEPGNLLPEFPGDIVVPNEPGNLLPEYDSSDEEMDVEGKNSKLQIEVDITRNPNTRMSNYQCRTPSPGCRVPSPDTRNSGFDILDERHLPDMFKSTYTYRVPSSGHPNPRLPGLGFGVRNSELVPSSEPEPETRQSRVSGVRNSELGMSKQKYIANMFRVPDTRTRDPAVSGFGVRGLVHLGLGFGTENLTYIFLGLDLVVDVYMYPMCLIRWWLHQLYVLMEHI